MYQETRENFPDLLYEQHSLWTTRMNRGQFLGVLGIFVGSILIACIPGSSNKPLVLPTSTPVSPKEAGYPLEPGEIGQTLNYGELLNIDIGGQIEFRNRSRQVTLTIAMSRISRQIGSDAGLLQLDRPLIMSFVDQPMSVDTTGAETYFNPQTGMSESEIVVPIFVNKLKTETELPNTVLTTIGRRNGYLSILLSQATLVEMSNQAHAQRYIGKEIDSTTQDQIDKASNQLGVKYTQQIIAGQAKPFVIVNGVNLS